MQRRDEIAAAGEAESFEDTRALARDRREGAQRIQHHVADLAGAVRQALALEVAHRLRRRREQEIRQVVRDEAVRLLGHAAVETAKARLDVGDRHVQLRRGERRRERRVGVAIGQHQVRPAFLHGLLEALQHAGRLAAVRTGADAEVEVRLGYAELGEKDVGQGRVVVLAGMNDDAFNGCAGGIRRFDRAGHGRELHELRARADHLHQADRRPCGVRAP